MNSASIMFILITQLYLLKGRTFSSGFQTVSSQIIITERESIRYCYYQDNPSCDCNRYQAPPSNGNLPTFEALPGVSCLAIPSNPTCRMRHPTTGVWSWCARSQTTIYAIFQVENTDDFLSSVENRKQTLADSLGCSKDDIEIEGTIMISEGLYLEIYALDTPSSSGDVYSLADASMDLASTYARTSGGYVAVEELSWINPCTDPTSGISCEGMPEHTPSKDYYDSPGDVPTCVIEASVEGVHAENSESTCQSFADSLNGMVMECHITQNIPNLSIDIALQDTSLATYYESLDSTVFISSLQNLPKNVVVHFAEIKDTMDPDTIQNECVGNLEFFECGTLCPKICGEPHPFVCIRGCEPNVCQCPGDLWLNGNQCVEEKECPPSNDHPIPERLPANLRFFGRRNLREDEESRCDWVPLPPSECPSDSISSTMEDCSEDMQPGELCKAETVLPNGNPNFNIDNCGTYDVYRFNCDSGQDV